MALKCMHTPGWFKDCHEDSRHSVSFCVWSVVIQDGRCKVLSLLFGSPISSPHSGPQPSQGGEGREMPGDALKDALR